MRKVIFKKLKLKNFKSHEELEFDFSTNKFVVITGNNGCLIGNTEIDIPRNLENDTSGIKIKDLVGKEIYVYSYNIDKKQLELKKASDIRKTGENKKVYKIYYKGRNYKGFKSYNYIILTEDHLLLKTDGQYIKVKNLSPGDKIMSLYRRTYDGYCHIRATHDNEYYEHKFISEQLNSSSELAHHKDHNKFNNFPENIIPMTKKEHTKYHAKWMHDNLPNVFMWSEHPKGMLNKKHTDEIKKQISNTLKRLYAEGIINKNDISKKSKEGWNKKLKGKKYLNKDWLFYQYWINKLNAIEIAKICNCCSSTIYNRLDQFGILRRDQSIVSKMQFENLDYKLKFMKSMEKRSLKQNINKKYCDYDWLYQKYIIEKLSTLKIGKLCGVSDTTIGIWLRKLEIESRKINHKIEKIEFFGYEDVYDMEVEDNHNFVANGIFVHNSGKSTIWDSISWCLYDQTLKKRKGDSVVRKRSGKNCFVGLTFSVDENEYEVRNYRKDSKYKNSKFLFINGEDANKNKEAIEDSIPIINKLIEDLIMPFDVFINVLMFSQFVGKSLTEVTDSKQMEIIDSMMGYGKYSEYYEMFKNESNRNALETSQLENTIPIIQETLERSAQLLSQEISNKNNSIMNQENQKNNLIQEVDNIKKMISNIENPSESLNRQIKNKEILQSEYVKLDLQINQHTKNKEEKLINLENLLENEGKQLELEVSSQYKDNINNINTQLTESENNVKLFQKQIESKNSELKTEYIQKNETITNARRNEMDPVNKKTNSLTSNIDSCKSSYITINKDIEKSNSEIGDIQNKLNDELPSCYTCGQEIKDKSLTKVKEKLKIKIEDQNKNRNNLIDINKKLSKETNELSQMNQLVEEIENDYKQKENDLENWKNIELEKLREHYNSTTNFLNLELNKFQSQKQTIEQNLKNELSKEVIKLNDKFSKTKNDVIDNCETNLSNYKKQIENININMKNVNNELEKLNQQKDLIQDYESDLNSKNDQIILLENSSKNLHQEYDDRISKIKFGVQSDNDKLNKININKEKLERKNSILKFWKKAFSATGIKAVILDESIPILNKRAKELSLLTDTIRVRFDSQRQLSSGDLRNKFSILPIQTKNLTDDRKDFSAGEGRLIDIITLLSFRHLVEKMHDVKFNIILADEILDALDPINVEIVLNVLRKLSEDYCVCLVTHTLRSSIESSDVLSL